MQLTNAMGLVASSKIRRANQSMLAGRDYAAALEETVSVLASDRECLKSPYMKEREPLKTKIIIIAGDRGLAGGYNANIFRLMAVKEIFSNPQSYGFMLRESDLYPTIPTAKEHTVTGAVSSWADIAKEHDLYLICDEVYREFCYDDKFGVPTMAHYRDIDENLVLIDSVSKRFSACGARVGCVVTKNRQLQKALLKSVSPAGALAYMVFILLYFPCIATFVAIRNESRSWKWAIITAVYTIILAWVAAFITFNIASLIL